ncbi:MAG: DUF2304 domain-containing protein [Methylohalobius sp.]|nr:DUF2304 domain-containing protein [Methylohalobius sp.]
MIPSRLTSAILGLAIASTILWLIARDRLHTRHAAWWFSVALAVVVLGVFPSLIDWLGSLLGVAYPPILTLVVAMGVLLVKLLLLDIEHSRQERTLRRLIQRLAILEAELEDKQKR